MLNLFKKLWLKILILVISIIFIIFFFKNLTELDLNYNNTKHYIDSIL